MEFRIADTFTDSLAKLTSDEQKAVKTTAFDLQINLAHPGMQFHKIDKARDPHFWSIRVSRDIRLIIQDGVKPTALLRRPSRSSLSLGCAPKTFNPSKDGCGSVG